MKRKNISSDSSTQITINKKREEFLATCSSVKGISGKGKSQFEALYNLLDRINLKNHYRTN